MNTAEFIWTNESLEERDRKVCFRKVFFKPAGVKELTVDIWADSRYFLWINGIFIETGPARCWPEYPQKDRIKVPVNEYSEQICIAVLIWNFGTSTSQYVHGNAGFWLSCMAADIQGEFLVFSDETWRCKKYTALQTPAPRINVSQTWVEIYNQSRFPAHWMTSDFNDYDWAYAKLATPPASHTGELYRLDNLPERGIPLLAKKIKKPQRVMFEKRISCRGIGVRVDYKNAFYPQDRTTEDILQTGYIACLIDSPIEQQVLITLADKLWPEIDEYIILNGERHTFPAGIKRKAIRLKKGENLFLLNISGARQRFSSDIHFLPKTGITFLPLIDGAKTLFAGVGPFESVRIGNIVCSDGFTVNTEEPNFVAVGECKDITALRKFGTWLKPVDNILFDGTKLRGIGADIKCIKSQKRQYAEPLFLEASNNDGDHEIILDMGAEVSGFLLFNIEADEAAELDFYFFEHLNRDVPEIPDDLDTSLRYSCLSGNHEFRSLHRRGFRYIAIRLRGNTRIAIKDLNVEERLYAFRTEAHFTTNDKVLDAIWLMCKRTVELCSEDVPADSPAFEQAFWVGDSYVMALYYQWLFNETDLMKHSLMLAARSMHYASLPDCHLPAGLHLLLTAWAELWIIAAKDYWLHTGNRDFLSELYPWLEKAAYAFASYIDTQGLFTIHAWNMLDWADMDTPYRGTITHLNALLVLCFRSLAELSSVLGFENKRKKWEQAALKLAENSDRIFWNAEKKCYIDCIHDDGKRSEVISIQSNLMMFLCGCIPEHKKDLIKKFIISPPKEAVLPGSPFMAHFYYDFLFSQGLGTRAVKGIRKQWKPMLTHGTCWETFKGFYKDRLTRSYCHAWSSAPSYLFGAYILGIKPLVPGFKKILIAPNPSGLKTAKGSVPIPAGKVEIIWEIKKNVFHCTVHLPSGTEYVFREPEQYRKDVKLTVHYI